MKFHLLPLGARFTLDGERYVKATPLVGEHLVSGQQRLIRRSADVAPLDSEASAAPSPRRAELPAQAVAAALAQFHGQVAGALDRARPQLGPELAQQLSLALEKAAADCLKTLGLPT